MLAPVDGDEFIVFLHKSQFHRTGRAVTLFGDNDFNHVLVFGFLVVIILTVQEGYDIGILLNTSGFT